MTLTTPVPLCDHTSAGAIAEENGRILMIRRKKYPFGYAPPSGHCDGRTYPAAAFYEFQEETGFTCIGAPTLILKDFKLELPCRRESGNHHIWSVFKVRWEGFMKLNEDEVLEANWFSRADIKVLADQTRSYLWILGSVAKLDDEKLAKDLHEHIARQWEQSPGLEESWLHLFTEMKVI